LLPFVILPFNRPSAVMRQRALAFQVPPLVEKRWQLRRTRARVLRKVTY
jgi:hypothetical protein